MPSINELDPRTILARDKFFSLRPKPLERWLWEQNLPSAAERVFWTHWSAGMQRGDWCSELSLRQVASECRIDTSTVTRSYQVLRRLGLIKREDPGRDKRRPFQQAIAITEVRVPRELLVELSREPNRPNRARKGEQPTQTRVAPEAPQKSEPPPGVQAPLRLTRAESAALLGKLSAAENSAFYVASRERHTDMQFDPETRLTEAERGQVTRILAGISAARPVAAVIPAAGAANRSACRTRTLSPLTAAQIRKAILRTVPPASAQALFAQVVWSIEEGALRQFAPAMAANIALKKIREGGWTRPNRMPPNWLQRASESALPETCGGA